MLKKLTHQTWVLINILTLRIKYNIFATVETLKAFYRPVTVPMVTYRIRYYNS